MTNGTRKLIKDQYLSVRTVLEANAKEMLTSLDSASRFPHYGTLQKRMNPVLFRFLHRAINSTLFP